MTSAFTHFLITRYNVPLKGWDVDRSGQPTRDKTWHEHRKKLFDQFCAPSIRAQSTKGFIWLIYCDKNTPQDFLNDINQSVSGIPEAVVHLVEDYHDCMGNIDKQMTLASTPYIVTSRVDNDDALGIHFMGTIQKHFIPQPFTILNLLHGHGYNVNRKIITQLKNIRNNHFGSLIEERNALGGHISIRGFQHGAPPDHFQIINIHQSHSWLKIFHDRNLKSSTFGYPVFENKIAKWYGIDAQHMPLLIINTFRYSVWWLMDGVSRKLKSPADKNK